MTYEELKKFDLLTIKSQDDLDSFKEKLFESEPNDILKYINFLRYQQYHTDISYKYIQYIVRFLAEDEICEIEKQHETILTGENEDLMLMINIPEMIENPIEIIATSFILKGSL